MAGLVIPALGTVQFIIYNLHNHDPHPPLLEIDGPTEWVRPVVGLVFDYFCDGPCDPLEPDQEGGWLRTDPLVVDEVGLVYRVHDYLHGVVGDLHWDHTTHIYTPHIAGPVTSAPRVRRVQAVS